MSSPNVYANNALLAGDLSSFTFYSITTYGASPSNTSAQNNTAIAAAIAAAQSHPGGSGIVMVPPGVYLTSATFLMYSGFCMCLLGTLKMSNGANNGFFTTPSPATGIWIFGTGTLDCNGANQSSVNAYGIQLTQTANVVIEGITILNAYYFPTTIYNCTNVTLRDVTVNTPSYTGWNGGLTLGLGFSGGTTAPSTNCWLERCSISNTHDEAIAFYGNVQDSGARDCYVNGAVFGIGCLNDSGQVTPSNRITISGCTVTGATNQAIFAFQNNGPLSNHQNLVITDNHTHGNSMNSLYLANCSNVVIGNNRFEENLISITACDHVITNYVQSANVGVTVTGALPVGSLVGQLAITYPYSFSSSTSYSITATCETGGGQCVALVNSKTATGCSIWLFNLQASVATTVFVDVIATGY
jgi:polygalacturonase